MWSNSHHHRKSGTTADGVRMLLNELANQSELSKAAGDAIKPYWKFKVAMVDQKRSRNGETVVQFRLGADADSAEEGYNELDHKQLDDKL